MELPPWLNEGLAELYSSLEPRGAKILVGQVIPARLQALRSDPWIPLSVLLTVDHQSPDYNERSRAGMFYAESWALVHMLNLDLAYRPQLKALVAALKEAIPRPPSRRPMASRLGEVEAALRTYFDGGTVLAQLFDVQVPKSWTLRRFSRRVVSRAPRTRRAAGELSRQGRGGACRVRSTGQGHPDSWEVEQGLGQFAWQQRNLSDAAQHFAASHGTGLQGSAGLPPLRANPGLQSSAERRGARVAEGGRSFPESDEVHLELGATLVRTGNYGAAAIALLP